MKGDTKSDNLFYRLILRDDFQADVKKCRDNFAIPAKGLQIGKETAGWHNSLGGRSEYGRFLDVLGRLLRSYKLSSSFINLLEEYVVTNETSTLYPGRPYPFCQIDTLDGRFATENWKDKKPFVSLLIYDYASLEETQEYLKKSWNNIKQSLDKQRGKPTRRIRRWTHKDRDEEILRLYEKSRAELGLKKGEYKQIGIARLIATKYGPIDSDYIKNIVLRRRRLKRGTI